ncbi:tmRNA tag peptide, partial [Streptococcus constellatus subsp. constellatus]
AKNNNSYALAA